jgi:hypothetical protein
VATNASPTSLRADEIVSPILTARIVPGWIVTVLGALALGI